MPNLPFMIAHGCYYAALGLWIGMMAMLAVGARVAFDTLPEKRAAGDLVGTWLAKYYRMGALFAVVAAVGAILRFSMAEQSLWKDVALTPWTPQRWIAFTRYLLLGFMIMIHLYAGWSLDPEVKRLKAIPEAAEVFRALHAREVLLLGANLLAGIVVIFLS